MQKPPPNSLSSDATRKPSPNSLPSDGKRKPSLPSHGIKNYYANHWAVEGNCSNDSSFDNAMSNQASLSHSVVPPESENNHNVVVLDDDMLIVNDKFQYNLEQLITRTSTIAEQEESY